MLSERKQHVIVLGAGFGGLRCAKTVAQDPNFLVTLVDRANYHLFLPLLYQVAIAGLEAPQIAEPVRSLVNENPNVRSLLATATRVDPHEQIVSVDERRLRYDYLVVATGSETTYLGVEGAEEHAFGLKRLGEAMAIRDQVLSACEEAAKTRDADHRRKLLTFIIVGGGATGVELAGSLAELRKRVIPKDYPELDPDEFRVVLVESTAHPLATMSEELQIYTERVLSDDFGVEFYNNSRVEKVFPTGVQIEGGGFVDGFTTVWTAGVQGATIEGLPEAGKGGRIETTPELHLPSFENIFVVGDINGLTRPESNEPYPQLAPMALQQGEWAAKNIIASSHGRSMRPFHYDDKGQLVTLGRNKGVADVGGREFRGFVAWFAWLTVHIIQLVGFRNRLLVLSSWVYSYVTYDFAVRIMHTRRSFPPR